MLPADVSVRVDHDHDHDYDYDGVNASMTVSMSSSSVLQNNAFLCRVDHKVDNKVALNFTKHLMLLGQDLIKYISRPRS